MRICSSISSREHSHVFKNSYQEYDMLNRKIKKSYEQRTSLTARKGESAE